MLFWSSFHYSIHVVINKEAYLESDKFKMYFVSDIFIILPEIICFLFLIARLALVLLFWRTIQMFMVLSCLNVTKHEDS